MLPNVCVIYKYILRFPNKFFITTETNYDAMARNTSNAYIIPQSAARMIMQDENIQENGIPFYHELNLNMGMCTNSI